MRLVKYCMVFLLLILMTVVMVWFKYRKVEKIKNPIKIEQKVQCSSLIGLDRDICKFINFESPYTSEEISKIILISKGGEILKLGLENLSKVEGLLLGYREKEESIILLIGFDGKNKDRFVTPLRIPVYAIEDNNISFSFLKLSSLSLSGDKSVLEFKNRKDIIETLEIVKGKVVFLSLIDDVVENYSAISNLNHKRLIEEVNNGVKTTRGLLGRVNGNGLNSPHSDLGSNLIEIKKNEDVDKINFIEVPIIAPSITYFEK